MTAYLISMATFAGLFMILALALNLQWGMTDMVNFGIAGFYATGGYTSGLLTTDAGWPFLAGFFAAGLLALVFGVGLALLSMRLRDDFLAIVSLGFGKIVRLFILNEDWLTHGPRGLQIEVRPMAGYFEREGYALFYLGLVSVVILIVFLVNEHIRKSPYGRVHHPFGTAGYDQITTLLLAIAKAKSSDGLKIAEAIHQVLNGFGKSVYKIEDGLAALAAGEEINFDGV